MEKDVTFTITCSMRERWVDDFCTMLKTMERNGQIGHSEEVGLYSDGDGDFRPHFSIDTDFIHTEPIKNEPTHKMFDAG